MRPAPERLVATHPGDGHHETPPCPGGGVRGQGNGIAAGPVPRPRPEPAPARPDIARPGQSLTDGVVPRRGFAAAQPMSQSPRVFSAARVCQTALAFGISVHGKVALDGAMGPFGHMSNRTRNTVLGTCPRGSPRRALTTLIWSTQVYRVFGRPNRALEREVLVAARRAQPGAPGGDAPLDGGRRRAAVARSRPAVHVRRMLRRGRRLAVQVRVAPRWRRGVLVALERVHAQGRHGGARRVHVHRGWPMGPSGHVVAQGRLRWRVHRAHLPGVVHVAGRKHDGLRLGRVGMLLRVRVGHRVQGERRVRLGLHAERVQRDAVLGAVAVRGDHVDGRGLAHAGRELDAEHHLGAQPGCALPGVRVHGLRVARGRQLGERVAISLGHRVVVRQLDDGHAVGRRHLAAELGGLLREREAV
mmetsp:Transcript_19850/g.66779  ORF Transcript_19850/g.66779 Transcript_19850/m.66779 type:complete len:416 (-) Transcript_19850:731-1978(-)